MVYLLKLYCSLFSKLQRDNTENSKQIFPEKELRGHSPNFHIHVSVSDLHIHSCRKYVDQSKEYMNS
jgi:hypothetical protein